jgi:hypothetical protein
MPTRIASQRDRRRWVNTMEAGPLMRTGRRFRAAMLPSMLWA